MQILFVIGVAGRHGRRGGRHPCSGRPGFLADGPAAAEHRCGQHHHAQVVEGTTEYLAFSKISNPFIGILCGLIGAWSYNRFKGMQLPDFLAFFSGKRFVAMAAAVVSIVASVILLFIWPLVFGALVPWATASPAWAPSARACTPSSTPADPHRHAPRSEQRVLVRHHRPGRPDQLLAGKTSADVTWSLGMYMSGFFPCMMFGVPAAAAAMIATAKNKKAAAGLLISTAVCAFVCGVTEPFEFSFCSWHSPCTWCTLSVRHLHRHHLLHPASVQASPSRPAPPTWLFSASCLLLKRPG